MRSEITTAEDLDAMTPAERQADFEARVVRGMDTLPPAFRQRLRSRLEERIAQIEEAEANTAL